MLKSRCERKRSSTDYESADAVMKVVVGSVLWQKVDILNMYGLKEI